MATLRRRAAPKAPRPRNKANMKLDDKIARCPGGTPAYQHRKEFLKHRPSVTEAEVKMARGADYKPLRTFKGLPAGTKKPARLNREEKPKFDTKWGWNHEDAWDVYYMTGKDPALS
ncbi:hypothetical protein H4I96_01707 [Botrytis cinerea]